MYLENCEHDEEDIKMGSMERVWKEGVAKSITFSVTEDCNLRCKYCYMTGKNKKNKMTFDVAKKAVDYILTNRDIFPEEAVIWEFIGGEPLLEISLIDKISDYIKKQMYILDHPWFSNYMFFMCSNGLLYHTKAVQDYIAKNKGHVSIGISIDGNKIKHNMQRVKLDGSGSYDDVVKNIPLWLSQFPGSMTKATFSHEDLPYLKDSIIALWDLGIKVVAANVVFEDVWEENDDEIFEEQLRELADYIIENKKWKDYSVRFFDPHIGFPMTKNDLNRAYCGSGKMLAVDYAGRFFPCVRFLDFCLNKNKSRCIGDICNGIDLDKIRPFLALSIGAQSTEECRNCEVASGCASCTGNNYDYSNTGTIFYRTIFNCKMHKAAVRANKYFWNKYSLVTGHMSPRESYKKELFKDNEWKMNSAKYLYFITSDNITPHCSYRNLKGTNNIMSKEVFEKGIKYAEENNFIPIFLGSLGNLVDEYMNNHFCFKISGNNEIKNKQTIIVHDNQDQIDNDDYLNYSGDAILLISKANISKISDFVRTLSTVYKRLNIVLENIENWSKMDIELYKVQLEFISEIILDSYREGRFFEINVITDLFYNTSMVSCGAGKNSFALSPEGKVYICPAFYFEDPNKYICTIDDHIELKDNYLFDLNYAPICKVCDVFHCKVCRYLNKKTTNEINIPPKIQCTISHIERDISKKLQEILTKENLIRPNNVIKDIKYNDPLERISYYGMGKIATNKEEKI